MASQTDMQNIRIIGFLNRDQLDVTCFIISLFNAQHVSDVNTSIPRGLRLICWVISWVVLLWFDVCWCYVVVWLEWCGIRMRASARIRIQGQDPSLSKLQHDPASLTVDTKTFTNHVWSVLFGWNTGDPLTVPLSAAATTTCVGGCRLSMLYSCCTQGQDRRDTM